MFFFSEMVDQPIGIMEEGYGSFEVSNFNLPSLSTNSELGSECHIPAMEIAIWLAFGRTSEETAWIFGRDRDLANWYVASTHIRVSLLPMITCDDSDRWFESSAPSSHQSVKLA